MKFEVLTATNGKIIIFLDCVAYDLKSILLKIIQTNNVRKFSFSFLHTSIFFGGYLVSDEMGM
jgi:hypothetical protein